METFIDLFCGIGGFRLALGLSILECKKLMGFPLKHFVSKVRQGYRQLGNAAIPRMIKAVYSGIYHVKT